MKKIITLFAATFLLGVTSFGQGIAPNWTLPDCSSTNHTLYNYLDSQEVVVMFFVMGCYTCTNAGNLMMELKDDYDVSHPGKVNFFLMDYYPTNTCYDVDTTWNTYHFDAYFSGCWAVKDHYYPTVYPMPAVVIAAGNYHTVIYNDLSWQNTDTTLIKQSIDHFFATAGIEENLQDKINIYPNPASETLTIDLAAIPKEEFEGIEVYDSNGKKMKLVYNTTNEIIQLPIGYFPTGNYVVLIETKSGSITKSFIKN